MGQSSSQDGHQATPSTPKYTKTIKNTMFFTTFATWPICKNTSKIVPKSAQDAPSWAALRYRGANMHQLGPFLLQLGVNLTHLGRILATIFGEILAQNHERRPQSTPSRSKTLPNHDFGRFSARRIMIFMHYSYVFWPILAYVFSVLDNHLAQK